MAFGLDDYQWRNGNFHSYSGSGLYEERKKEREEVKVIKKRSKPAKLLVSFFPSGGWLVKADGLEDQEARLDIANILKRRGLARFCRHLGDGSIRHLEVDGGKQKVCGLEIFPPKMVPELFQDLLSLVRTEG